MKKPIWVWTIGISAIVLGVYSIFMNVLAWQRAPLLGGYTGSQLVALWVGLGSGVILVVCGIGFIDLRAWACKGLEIIAWIGIWPGLVGAGLAIFSIIRGDITLGFIKMAVWSILWVACFHRVAKFLSSATVRTLVR